MTNPAVKNARILKLSEENFSSEIDLVAVEEPLEISLSIPTATPPLISKNISITMRTPGSDTDLALGFLFTEGVLRSFEQLKKVESSENAINVVLNGEEGVDLSKLERHFYTSSSCGVCGKSSIEMIRTSPQFASLGSNFKVAPELVKSLPSKLRKQQRLFESTGGLHAAALFSLEGAIAGLCEDVGRHNALDKLIGQALQKQQLPLNRHLLLLSGRASFELIQKAVMAGISFVMAVGAPSSLAVDLAKEHEITLLGFLKADRFNVYNDADRIIF